MTATDTGREAAALELVKLSRRGPDERETAVSALYELYKDECYAFLVKFTRDAALAEDVLQESFLRVYKSLDSHDGARPVRHWLHRIVRNAALDALESRKKETRAIKRAAPARPVAAEPTALGEIVQQEELARTKDALDVLPDETRALLLQRHGLGMTLDEIARVWEVTERTIRNRLHAAARELARLLDRAPLKDEVTSD